MADVETIMRAELTALGVKAAKLAQYHELTHLTITVIPEEDPERPYVRVSACDKDGGRETWTKDWRAGE